MGVCGRWFFRSKQHTAPVAGRCCRARPELGKGKGLQRQGTRYRLHPSAMVTPPSARSAPPSAPPQALGLGQRRGAASSRRPHGRRRRGATPPRRSARQPSAARRGQQRRVARPGAGLGRGDACVPSPATNARVRGATLLRQLQPQPPRPAPAASASAKGWCTRKKEKRKRKRPKPRRRLSRLSPHRSAPAPPGREARRTRPGHARTRQPPRRRPARLAARQGAC